jgi:LmbE family N-acetylglucosaminyl deacetylase
MTNGDYDCVVDGLVRQQESLRGLSTLGVGADRVHFLGYPDGSLAALGSAPLPPVRRKIGGVCAEGNTTYGTRTPSLPYTRENAVADLTRLLRELAPDEVVLTHPADTHPDHATTYLLFRDALDRLPRAPRVHRAIVHNGDCWPMSDDPREPCPNTPFDLAAPTLPLSGRLAGYVARERLPVSDRHRRAKLRAIAAYESQTRGSHDSYLFAFARSDEMFFPETFERAGTRWQSRGVTSTSTTLALGPYRVERRASDAKLYVGSTLHETWPLPHDFRAKNDASCALSMAPRPDEGGVDELTLTCDAAHLGISIARPPRIDLRSGIP